MIIHQIFLKVSDKNLEDYPCYIEGIKIWKDFCKKHNWEYKLHQKIDYNLMNEEEKTILKTGTNRFNFFKIDYYRLILLSKYGGMYVDLDVIPTDYFKSIMNEKILIGRSIDKGDNKFYPNNNLMKLPIDIATKLKQYAHSQYYDKLNIKVYETWRVRFFLHTVSACMLTRFCKKNKISFLLDFDKYFTDYNTGAWDTSALKKQLKKKTPIITNMEEIKVVKIYSTDDNVKMTGGKCKGCEGVIVKVMKLFCSVRITKDKKGNPVFSAKPSKVKRDHIVIVEPSPLEMPSAGDLKAVDDLEPHKNLLDEIDNKLIDECKTENIKTLIEEVKNEETGESNPNLVYDVQDVISKKNAILVDEHGIRSNLPTIDDCINLRDENETLKLQIEALVGWQSHASAECAKHRKDYIDLKKQLDDLLMKVLSLKKMN